MVFVKTATPIALEEVASRVVTMDVVAGEVVEVEVAEVIAMIDIVVVRLSMCFIDPLITTD